jgi:beta-lactamase regulating signal transducer with metallopeptidase domain
MKSLLSGLKWFIIGAIIGILIYLIKMIIWKDKVPDLVSKLRWFIASLLAIISLFICYFIELKSHAITLIAAGVFLSSVNALKNHKNESN